jgi:hypothetical protein
MNIFAAAHSIGSTGIMFGAWFTLGMGMIDQLRRMNRRHEAGAAGSTTHKTKGTDMNTNPHEDDAAYEAHLAAEQERMCPEVRAMEAGFDDPMTVAYGAADVVAAAISRHVRRCYHPWCREQRGD